MRRIALFRIDERLVHGQVVTAWLGHTKADEIIVADDTTAHDSLMSSMIKMAVPPDVSVQVLTVDQARGVLGDIDQESRAMVIVRTPENARKVLAGIGKSLLISVNMGNSGMAAQRIKLTANVYLDKAGIKELKQIAALGYKVYFQAVPGTARYEWEDVMKRYREGE